MKREKAIKRFCVFLLISAIFILSSQSFISKAVSAERPIKGGILKVLTKWSPRSIGWPASGGGPDTFNIYPCVQTLTFIDAEGKPAPLLLESWKYSQDFKTLTLKIRKGIKFHDGSDFNAEAVKLNLEDRKYGNWDQHMKTVGTIDVIDPYTLRLNLNEYKNTLLVNFADVVGCMISPRVLERGKTDEGKEWAQVNPVGTGPFKFVKFERDVLLKYERFDGYWEKGKPYLDGIEFHYIKDPMTSVAAFRAGEADALLDIDPKQASELKRDGYIIVPNVFGSLRALAGDTNNPQSIFVNKKVREAMEYAINRKAMADGLGYGFWEPVNQISSKRSNGYNPDLVGRPYNPEKARQLLAEAGYPNGFKTQFIAGIENTSREEMVLLQQDMKAVGIDVEIVFYDAARYFPALVKGQKNSILEFGNLQPMNYAQEMASLFTVGSLRLKFLKRPDELQETLVKVETAPDYETQTALVKKAVRFISDEAIVIPLFVNPNLHVLTKRLNDANFGGEKYQWTPAKAWLSK